MDKSILFKLSYGLYIVGTTAEGKPAGAVVNTVFQVTGEPAKLAVCINKNNYTCGAVQKTGRFCVSILSEDTPKEVISAIGYSSGSEKFSNVYYTIIDEGLTRIDAACAGYLTCEVESSLDVGTHILFVARITDTDPGEGEPMTYAYFHNVIKGKAPKNAPTYVEEAPAAKCVCGVCGYEYEGTLDDMPDDYACPLCGAPKSKFASR